MVRILLIQPRITDARHQRYPPLGLLAVGSYLTSRGHDVVISDRNTETEPVSRTLRRVEPTLVGISSFTGSMIMDGLSIARRIRRECPDLPIVWGGVHPSLLPEQTLASGLADFVAIGEGEFTLAELADRIEAGQSVDGVAGLALRIGDRAVIGEPRPFADLPSLPPTAWDMIRPELYFQGFGHCDRLIRTYTSKGCSGQCKFCYNGAFHKRQWRGRTPEQVADEAALLAWHYGADGIGFVDELWSPDRDRLRQICELLIDRKIEVSWYFNARVDQYDEDDLRLMHRAGCRWILFGVETGSPAVLKRIRKGISFSRVQEMFDACNRLGISTIASFMCGFPGETADDLSQTARFAMNLNPTYFDFTRYTSYPGTELYEEIVAAGAFQPPATLEDWVQISSWDHATLNLTRVSCRELGVFIDYFTWLNLRRLSGSGQRQTLLGYLRKFRPSPGMGLARIALELLVSVYETGRVLLNVAVHPRIRKRLGLTPGGSRRG